MKKTMMAGLIIVLGLGTTQLHAQKISGGIKAEANLSNFILTDLDGVDSNMGFGASLGGFVKFDLCKNFAIQPEMLVHFLTSEREALRIKNDYEYWGMEVPVYAVGQWYTGPKSRFYAGVGPYVGVGFDARYKDPEIKLYDDNRMQRWDFGFGAQIGYEFARHFQLNASYKIGVINALDEAKDDATMLPQRIALGIGFRF